MARQPTCNSCTMDPECPLVTTSRLKEVLLTHMKTLTLDLQRIHAGYITRILETYSHQTDVLTIEPLDRERRRRRLKHPRLCPLCRRSSGYNQVGTTPSTSGSESTASASPEPRWALEKRITEKQWRITKVIAQTTRSLWELQLLTSHPSEMCDVLATLPVR